MIFKSLHNKLLNKKISNSLDKLSQQTRSKPNPIKTLGCIVDPSFPISVENFIDLSISLGLKEKDLKIITFQENKNIFNVFSERLKIENIDFVDWIKQEYNTDILNSSFKSRIEWKRTANDLMEFSNAKNKR